MRLATKLEINDIKSNHFCHLSKDCKVLIDDENLLDLTWRQVLSNFKLHCEPNEMIAHYGSNGINYFVLIKLK